MTSPRCENFRSIANHYDELARNYVGSINLVATIKFAAECEHYPSFENMKTRRAIFKIFVSLGFYLLLYPPNFAVAQIVHYGKKGLFGGYKDKQIETGIWKVTATSNAASGGAPFAQAMALYRAGELLRQAGFSHMRILDQKGWDSGTTIVVAGTSSYRSSGGPGYAMLVVRGATSNADEQGCRSKIKERCKTFEILPMMESLEPHIRF